MEVLSSGSSSLTLTVGGGRVEALMEQIHPLRVFAEWLCRVEWLASAEGRITDRLAEAAAYTA